MDLPPFRRGCALLGFMSEQEALDFLKGTCIFENESELKSSLEKWASASKAVSELRRGSLAPPEKKEIPREVREHLEKLSAQDTCKP